MKKYLPLIISITNLLIIILCIFFKLGRFEGDIEVYYDYFNMGLAYAEMRLFFIILVFINILLNLLIVYVLKKKTTNLVCIISTLIISVFGIFVNVLTIVKVSVYEPICYIIILFLILNIILSVYNIFIKIKEKYQ